MILSYFIRGKEVHIATDTTEDIYRVSDSRELADNIIVFISDAVSKCPNKNITEVVYSLGPASFTTLRIIDSIAKGMFISNPNIKFIGVSSFLTYLSVAVQKSEKGLIIIPTMRGDYFTCEYLVGALQGQQILKSENIRKCSGNVLFDDGPIFDNANLASIQKIVANSELGKNNPTHIIQSIKINYGFTPEYKF